MSNTFFISDGSFCLVLYTVFSSLITYFLDYKKKMVALNHEHNKMTKKSKTIFLFLFVFAASSLVWLTLMTLQRRSRCTNNTLI